MSRLDEDRSDSDNEGTRNVSTPASRRSAYRPLTAGDSMNNEGFTRGSSERRDSRQHSLSHLNTIDASKPILPPLRQILQDTMPEVTGISQEHVQRSTQPLPYESSYITLDSRLSSFDRSRQPIADAMLTRPLSVSTGSSSSSPRVPTAMYEPGRGSDALARPLSSYQTLTAAGGNQWAGREVRPSMRYSTHESPAHSSSAIFQPPYPRDALPLPMTRPYDGRRIDRSYRPSTRASPSAHSGESNLDYLTRQRLLHLRVNERSHQHVQSDYPRWGRPREFLPHPHDGSSDHPRHSIERDYPGRVSSNSAFEAHMGKMRKRSNLPKTATEIMKGWFDRNIANPYPTEEEKAMIANISGITMTQVSNWFINHRRRCPELRDKRERVRGCL